MGNVPGSSMQPHSSSARTLFHGLFSVSPNQAVLRGCKSMVSMHVMAKPRSRVCARVKGTNLAGSMTSVARVRHLRPLWTPPSGQPWTQPPHQRSPQLKALRVSPRCHQQRHRHRRQAMHRHGTPLSHRRQHLHGRRPSCQQRHRRHIQQRNQQHAHHRRAHLRCRQRHQHHCRL